MRPRLTTGCAGLRSPSYVATTFTIRKPSSVPMHAVHRKHSPIANYLRPRSADVVTPRFNNQSTGLSGMHLIQEFCLSLSRGKKKQPHRAAPKSSSQLSLVCCRSHGECWNSGLLYRPQQWNRGSLDCPLQSSSGYLWRSLPYVSRGFLWHSLRCICRSCHELLVDSAGHYCGSYGHGPAYTSPVVKVTSP
jgi:hypothetical protein